MTEQNDPGRSPWWLALLLVVGLAGLFTGLVLLSLGPGQLPALLTGEEPGATATIRPAPTATRAPPATIAPRAPATATPLPPGLRFVLDPATIEYLPRAGRCNWSGVAGRVLRRNGAGAAGLQVHLRNLSSGQEASVISDARGNFELRLGDLPLLSPWEVQLRSAAGAPLSGVTQVVTSERCDQNLMMLIFNEQG